MFFEIEILSDDLTLIQLIENKIYANYNHFRVLLMGNLEMLLPVDN